MCVIVCVEYDMFVDVESGSKSVNRLGSTLLYNIVCRMFCSGDLKIVFTRA